VRKPPRSMPTWHAQLQANVARSDLDNHSGSRAVVPVRATREVIWSSTPAGRARSFVMTGSGVRAPLAAPIKSTS
jgi:hypothetical protein